MKPVSFSSFLSYCISSPSARVFFLGGGCAGTYGSVDTTQQKLRVPQLSRERHVCHASKLGRFHLEILFRGVSEALSSRAGCRLETYWRCNRSGCRLRGRCRGTRGSPGHPNPRRPARSGMRRLQFALERWRRYKWEGRQTLDLVVFDEALEFAARTVCGLYGV